eukprot:Skav201802  [mRNA]  locus=scaffold1071:34155:36345:+ [translate_table: standard]
MSKAAGASWFGRIKSFHPDNGYGFIECSEAHQRFGRDVYLSRDELQKLDIETIPDGIEVSFEIEVCQGRPRARNLALATGLLERALRQRQCEYWLSQYAVALKKLAQALESNGLDANSFAGLQHAESILQCEECIRDERTQGDLRMDDGSDQDVIRKFLRANDSSTDGTSIDCKRRVGRSTAVSQDVHIHVSNLERSVEETQLREHLLQAGAMEPLKVKIARRPNGQSNCHGWVTLSSPELAEEFLQLTIPPLKGRELKVRLDHVSATKQPSGPGGGWVHCQACYQACAPLLDVLLVEGVRHRRDNVPAGKFDQTPTFFCVGREASLDNCEVISPHPDPAGSSFKLAQILCKTCGADLGNVQKGSLMQHGVVDLIGERVVHLKCASVLLELSDRPDFFLEVRKWQYLAQATGRESIYRLSQLTMQEATNQLGLDLSSKVPDRNTNRYARLVPRKLVNEDLANSGYPQHIGQD